MMQTIKEFLEFIFKRKKYWLFPVFFILFIFGAVFVLTQGTVVAPFIYSIF
tara:strand:+ start:164 stop:316 length:153 start_codon:yes stop_codon:yes gene_type:complete